MNDDFKFFFPFEIVKAEPSSPGEYKEWRIGGYASTPDKDRQNDIILQRGLDISEFVNHGWFNFDHHEDIIIGYPDKSKCKINNNGFYVEGVLLKDIPQAKSMWETALALKKAGSDRKLGFSVEGKILKKNEFGKIVKARVYNVAITPNPVNTSCTWDVIVKSFTTHESDLEKSLEAGYGENPVIPESLEQAFKTLSYVIGDDKESKAHMESLKKILMSKSELSRSENLLFLQVIKGLSSAEAIKLYTEVDRRKQHE